MGEVYRAPDAKLKRDVAIKILPPTVTARRTAGALRTGSGSCWPRSIIRHRDIYGTEQSADLHALALELVEGDELAQRIARGRPPSREALAIARQIADALEAAHEQRIIHRDLKPANVKVRPDGKVKVLDFGLAKPIAIPGAPDGPSQRRRSAPPMTEAGSILGTVAYMSPEQARGRPVDERSDVWAFGCVLYEMLSGRRAFEGDGCRGHAVARAAA